MMKSKIIGEAIRFGVVGVVATLLHYGMYLLLDEALNPTIAYTIGYAFGFIVNFYLSAYFTFSTTPSWRKLIGMGGAHLINYLLHIVLLNLFLFLGIPKTYAPFPVFAIAIPASFFMVRFVYKRKK